MKQQNSRRTGNSTKGTYIRLQSVNFLEKLALRSKDAIKI